MYEINKTNKIYKSEKEFEKDYVMSQKISNDDCLDIFHVENSAESGMPDLIYNDINRRATYIELKYEKGGYIEFKKTQPSWYKRHKDLTILIIAYRLKDRSFHYMDAEYVLKNIKGLKVKLDV